MTSKITVVFEDELNNRLRQYSKDNGGRSVASIIREAVSDWLLAEELMAKEGGK